MKKTPSSRRTFIKKLGAASMTATIPGILAAKQEHRFLEMPDIRPKTYSPNDLIRIGIIGAGECKDHFLFKVEYTKGRIILAFLAKLQHIFPCFQQ